LQGRTKSSTREEENLQLQLKERKKQEEILWRQKSIVQWFKEGERNTKFFHRSMMHRRYINIITKLEYAQGNHILDHAGIESQLVSYYKDLLSKPIMDRTQAIKKITQYIPSLIILEHNESLMRPITQEEVDQAVKEMAMGKARGLDGFTKEFFHYYWSTIREEV